MNLVKAETARFLSRRFIQIMLVSLLVTFGITIFTVMASSEPASPERWAQAHQQAEQQKTYLAREYDRCRKATTTTKHCEELNPDRIVPEDYLYGVFHFGLQIKNLLYFLGAFLSLFGYLVMASFIGSEMHSGGMTNLLLWRPKRLQVLGSKLAVGLGLIGALSAVFSAVYVGIFWAIARTTGYSGGVTTAFWGEIGVLGLRAIGMALFASVIAFAIATIGRHTAAALGSLLGYVIVWEGGARLVMSLVLQRAGSGVDPYFLSTYVAAWFNGEYRYYPHTWGYHDAPVTIHWWNAATLFGVIIAAAVAIAFTSFRKRDLA